jgi:SMI1-KNR4 cell-wall
MADVDWSPSRVFGARYRAARAATPNELQQSETRVSAQLPDDLRQLYLTSDGVWDIAGQWFVVWPLAQLVDANAVLAEDNEWSETDLVAFGDDGTGNPFCFRRSALGIYFWSHVDAEATLLAPDLQTFWDGWMQDRLPPH